jgi:hypothetical protein
MIRGYAEVAQTKNPAGSLLAGFELSAKSACALFAK